MRPNIWKLQAERDIDGLIEALQYSDPDIRKRAAAALRVIGTTRATFALDRALRDEKNPYVREHISSALAYLRHDNLIEDLFINKNVSGLIEMLNSPRTDDVLHAIEALGNLGDRSATEGLVMVFRNGLVSDDVRLAAAQALLKLESAPAVVTLLAALGKNEWQVRRNAVTVLGQLKATWATTPIAKALRDPHAKVRKSAEYALKQINTPDAQEVLQRYYQEDKIHQTSPLPDVLSQQFEVKMNAGVAVQKEVVGSADTTAMTLVSSQNLRDALQERQSIMKGRDEDLSPALAAAEAALAQLSPDGEFIFDEDETVSDETDPSDTEFDE